MLYAKIMLDYAHYAHPENLPSMVRYSCRRYGQKPKSHLSPRVRPITRGQKNALTTMSTIRSPDLMLLVVVRTTVRTRTRRTTTVHQSIP